MACARGKSLEVGLADMVRRHLIKFRYMWVKAFL